MPTEPLDGWDGWRTESLSPGMNMALDEALLLTAALRRRPCLRFYSWLGQPASFGYFTRYDAVARSTPLRPLVRRPTGGGLVAHDCDWTYSVVIPPGHPWYAARAQASYRRMHEWVARGLAAVGVRSSLAPAPKAAATGVCFSRAEQFDVICGDGKIAGAAQRRTKEGLLIQGSVRPPPEVSCRAEWEEAMRCEAVSQDGAAWSSLVPDDSLWALALRLDEQKYSNPAFTHRL